MDLFGYIRDLLLLDVSLFAAFSGHIVKTRPYAIRVFLLKWLDSIKNNKFMSFPIINNIPIFIENHFLIKGKKLTKLHWGVIVLNSLYTMLYVFIINATTMENLLNLYKQEIIAPFLICTLLSMLFIYFFAIKCDEENINVEKLNEKYLEFSGEEIDIDQELLLIAGNLSFLGVVPVISGLDNKYRDKCRNSIKNDDCNERKCPRSNCILKYKQFHQLLQLHNEKKIKLRLLVRKPKDDGEDSRHKAVLGRLYKFFGKDIEIKFYKDNISSNIQLLARIKIHKGNPIMFWHWKNSDKTYGTPATLTDDSPKGKTFIYLFKDLLWEEAIPASPDELNSYEDAFDMAMKKG